MSKKANPTAIGLFIVVGVALGIIGVLLFSSTKLFTRTHECIVYFNDSLSGLNEGAPVKYRGVTIGSVQRVMVRYNQATKDYAMPVIIELQDKLIRRRLGEPIDVFATQALENRIKYGLRASLQTESLVTGVLYIDMRHNPNVPAVYHQLVTNYTEIPVEPTQIQQVFNSLASLDLKSIETNINTVLIRVDSVLANLPLAEIAQNATNVLHSIQDLVSSPELTNDLVAVRTTLEQYRVVAENLNRRIDPLADNLTNSLAQASQALSQIRGAAENLRSFVAPDSPLRNELELTLQQLAGAVQSLSTFADFLKQHPNALITGRRIPERKP